MDRFINLRLMSVPTNWLYCLCVVLAASIIAHQCLALTFPGPVQIGTPAGSPAPDSDTTSRTQK